MRTFYGSQNHQSQSTIVRNIQKYRFIRGSEKNEKTFVAIVQNKISIWFAEVFLKILKCTFDDVHMKLDLVGPQHGLFYKKYLVSPGWRIRHKNVIKP